MSDRPVRIANCAGWLWDRFSGLRDALAGPVDVVTGDYLAEPTLRQLALERAQDPALGYARSFLAQFTDAVGLLAERGARLVVDAGGLNPAGLADEVRRVIAEAGLELVVAHVEGDDLSARLDTLGALEHLDTGVPLADSGLEPTTANAYLGGWGIAAALAGGADVVICPRVTDASLTVGAAAWWHRWSTEDWGPLAGAVAAAHVIECGPQATGGNFSGFTTVPRVDDLGYPIAEIAADGTAVITKHEVAGGTVTTDTVTAQLLYEIQGPTYLNPDVTVHLDDVVLTRVAPDRVEITGVTGSPPPPTTKLAMTAPGGFESSVAFYATGLDLEAKVALLRTHVERITDGLDLSLLRVDRIGTPAEDPPDQWAAAQQILVTAQSRTRSQVDAQHFVAPMTGLFLPGYPGLYVSPLKVCAPVVRVLARARADGRPRPRRGHRRRDAHAREGHAGPRAGDGPAATGRRAAGPRPRADPPRPARPRRARALRRQGRQLERRAVDRRRPDTRAPGTGSARRCRPSACGHCSPTPPTSWSSATSSRRCGRCISSSTTSSARARRPTGGPTSPARPWPSSCGPASSPCRRHC